MSNKDYTKFSNNKPEEKKFETITVHVPRPVEVAETEVEETIDEIVESIEPSKVGVVVDCTRLNVRVAPNANADVVCVIDASVNIIIDEAESTDDFYAVCTESGAEGYCMKQFIKIIP